MKQPTLRRGLLTLAVGLCLGISAGVYAAGQGRTTPIDRTQYADRMDFSQVDSGHSWDAFIVYYDENRHSNDRESVSRDAIKAAKAIGTEATYERQIATGGHLIRLPFQISGQQAEVFMTEMAKAEALSYIEPDAWMTIKLTPNDSSYSSQWHYYESTAGMNLPAAWDIATGSGVTVAVLDTGRTNHSDLDANTVAGYDFISSSTTARDGNGRDSNPQDEGDWYASNECGFAGSSNSSWHGTHVAGTIAAVTNNSSGVAGVAFGAKIQHVRVLGKCGGSLSDIADGIIWASGGSVSGIPANATPSKVINMSLGGGGACGTTYQNAITSAVNRGTVVVVAAGNENTNASNSRPANCNNVIAVAATDRQGNRAYYSNYGSVVDVAAPGGETNAGSTNGVLSTLNAGTTTPAGQSYAYYQGTSMATPHVAGLAALMLSKNGSQTPAQIESTMKANVRAFAGSCSQCGSGLVDAAKTLQALNGGGGTPPPPPTGSLTNGTPVTGLAGSAGTELRFTMSVPTGASNLSFVMSGGTGDADLYVRFGSAPTTSTYNCRPYLSGNAETCSFATPQVGTYHVLVRGYSTFSGVSLTGSYTTGGGGGTQPSFFQNTANYNIPDRGTVESPITVSGRTGNASSTLRVAVDIKHTYRGDLQIDLIAPSGTSFRLKNTSSSDSADNVIATYTVNASAVVANGTWRLRVRDAYSGDTGFIDAWSLQF